jgi:hypothetical protein
LNLFVELSGASIEDDEKDEIRDELEDKSDEIRDLVHSLHAVPLKILPVRAFHLISLSFAFGFLLLFPRLFAIDAIGRRDGALCL